MLGISTGFVLSGFTAIATITMIILLGIWTYKDAENKGMIPQTTRHKVIKMF